MKEEKRPELEYNNPIHLQCTFQTRWTLSPPGRLQRWKHRTEVDAGRMKSAAKEVKVHVVREETQIGG